MSALLSPGTDFLNGQSPVTTPFQTSYPSLSEVPLPSPNDNSSSGDDYFVEHQAHSLCQTLRLQGCVINVCYPAGGEKSLAEQLAIALGQMLSGGSTSVLPVEMRRDGPHWHTRSEITNNYVFVGLPPVRTRGRGEEDFFSPLAQNGRRVTEVVFVDVPATTPSHKTFQPKHSKEFLHLDSGAGVDDLVLRIIGHFGAVQPRPFDIDNAYWSKVPKLINVNKDRNSLGITLVTRQMHPTSLFPRIALIKALNEDCVSDLRRRVGRYTHIQSINGCYLDGYSIKTISALFKAETKRDNIQLMVRFIHSKRDIKPAQPTDEMITTAAHLDPSREDLPVPLFILSDNTEMSSTLFQSLTSNCSHRPSISSLAPPTAGSAVSSGSGEPKFGIGNDGSGVSNQEPDEYGDTMPPLEPSPRKPKTNKLWFSVPSDESMRRGSIGKNLSHGEGSPTTPLPNAPEYVRMLSVSKSIASRHYVPQMFARGFERKFAHIFLRKAGIYLLTALLDDLADDPLIQFENLSYWIRSVQQATGNTEEKRTIIVGVYNSQDTEALPQINRYVGVLSEALKERELQKQLFDINQHTKRAASKNCYVFMFDQSNPGESCARLYSVIERCMDLFAEKWYHFYTEKFENVFKAFDGLNVALRELSVIKKIVANQEDVRAITRQKPSYALSTLAAYSTSLIDASESIKDALLAPHFLIMLMNNLGSTFTDTQQHESAIYEIFKIGNKQLCQLPVVTKPWPGYVMEQLAPSFSEYPITEHEKEVVVQWAERLELMFRIETGAPACTVYYFIPSLASEAMGDGAKFHWDSQRAKEFLQPEVTVLYGFLHFPCNHQFFDQLLTLLINEGLATKDKMFINCGCKEAILPLTLGDSHAHISAYTAYHPLQNVIEFRARVRRNQKMLFKEAVLKKLDLTFSGSQFHKMINFQGAVTLHVPHNQYEDHFISTALWKLSEMEEDNDEDDGKLLRTRELTKMDSLGGPSITEKEIEPSTFLDWALILSSSHENWTQLAGELKLLTTTEIGRYTATPSQEGNGAVVIRKWQQSNLSVHNLVTALNEIHLNQLASKVESYFKQPVSDV